MAAAVLWGGAVAALPVVLQARVVRLAGPGADVLSSIYVVAFQVAIAGGTTLGGAVLGRPGVAVVGASLLVLAGGGLLHERSRPAAGGSTTRDSTTRDSTSRDSTSRDSTSRDSTRRGSTRRGSTRRGSTTRDSTTRDSPTRGRLLVVHGYGAAPDRHWFPWLARQVDDRDVHVIELPRADDPDPREWAARLAAVIGRPHESDAIVAHSLGTVAVLRHLGHLDGDWRLHRLALVSGFADPLPGLPELDGFVADASPVVAPSLARVRDRVDRVTVIRSDDDTIVPPHLTDRLAGALGATPVVVPGAGHFIDETGTVELPAVLDALR